MNQQSPHTPSPAFHCLKKAVQNGFSIVETQKGVLSQNESTKSPHTITCISLFEKGCPEWIFRC